MSPNFLTKNSSLLPHPPFLTTLGLLTLLLSYSHSPIHLPLSPFFEISNLPSYLFFQPCWPILPLLSLSHFLTHHSPVSNPHFQHLTPLLPNLPLLFVIHLLFHLSPLIHPFQPPFPLTLLAPLLLLLLLLFLLLP